MGCDVAGQAGCQHASDVLRPYSALDYAWDEPGLPHTLLLELPGSCSLGQFQLDKVPPFLLRPSCSLVLHICCAPADWECMHCRNAFSIKV